MTEIRWKLQAQQYEQRITDLLAALRDIDDYAKGAGWYPISEKARRALAGSSNGVSLPKSETTPVTDESLRTQLNELKDWCIPLIEYFDDLDHSEKGLDVRTWEAVERVRVRVFGVSKPI